MVFFLIVYLSILISYIAPKREKNWALLCSFALIFILWALQYKMTQDWNTNYHRWLAANNMTSLYHWERDLEPVILMLLKLSKPIGFFGWNICCAFFELFVIWKYIKKFVSPRYYWVSVAVLTLSVLHALLLINSNRHGLAVIVMMLCTYTLLSFKIPINNIGFKIVAKILVFFLFYVIAINIHGGAYASFLILVFYLMAIKIKKVNVVYLMVILNLLFFSRFLFESSSLQEFFIMIYSKTSLEHFDGYIESLQTTENLSKINGIISFVFLNLTGLLYNRMKLSMRLFSCLLLFAIVFRPFMTGNLDRVFQYYQIYSIILIPYLFRLLSTSKYEIVKELSFPFGMFLFVLASYDLYKSVTTSYLWMRWLDFTTIFSQPNWI